MLKPQRDPQAPTLSLRCLLPSNRWDQSKPRVTRGFRHRKDRMVCTSWLFPIETDDTDDTFLCYESKLVRQFLRRACKFWHESVQSNEPTYSFQCLSVSWIPMEENLIGQDPFALSRSVDMQISYLRGSSLRKPEWRCQSPALAQGVQWSCFSDVLKTHDLGDFSLRS